jgi:hypothetical protein
MCRLIEWGRPDREDLLAELVVDAYEDLADALKAASSQGERATLRNERTCPTAYRRGAARRSARGGQPP